MFALNRGDNHSRNRHALSLLLIAIFASVFAHFLFKTHIAAHTDRSALMRWRIQLEDLDAGVNVWEKHAHPNTPLMTLLLKPFLELPPALGSSMWFLCKTIFALASILGVLALLDSGARPLPLWGKLLAVALSLRPIAGDLMHGNVNLLILALIVGMLGATLHGRPKLAGTLLGLAIVCKLTPALFLLYFLWKRTWSIVLTTAISVIVFALLPATLFGWSRNIEYWQSWHRQMIAPYAAGMVTSEHQNQSLPGLLHRMLSDEPSFSDFEGERKIVLETHNLVSWDRRAVQGIVLAALALCAVAGMRYCRAPLDGSRLYVVAEFSVVILGMLLFCERTWKHHCVTLLLPISVLAFVTATGSRRMRWFAGATLVLASLSMLSTSTGMFDAHDRFGKLAQVYGAYTWAFLLLLAGMFVILRSSCEAGEAACPTASRT